MANVDNSFGLRPVRHENGAPYNGSCNPYLISATGSALFVGDPVVITGTANTAEVSAPGAGTFPPGTLPVIDKATAGDGNAVTGVITAFAANPDGLSTLHVAASTSGRIAFVADDPDVLFEIQADGTIAATQIGLNAVLIYTNSGSTVTGLSGVELDTTSDPPAADPSNQLTIRAIQNRADNELATANPVLLVSINNHTFGDAASGI